MSSSPRDPTLRAVAVVGVGAILPDAPTAPVFWENVVAGKDSITEVPPERWSIADYYDADPAAPGKTYSKIGGWVRGFTFDALKYRIPPRVAAAMDQGQMWSVIAAADALRDAGHPDRPLDLENTAVILGNAMGGELHYLTCLGLFSPEYVRALEETEVFQRLPEGKRAALRRELCEAAARRFPPTTEDTMPGELSNIMAGRIASVLNLRGPNYTTDAACASSLAALDAAIQGLCDHHFDAVLSGGMDRNMGPTSFVKFCKIGALSATGSRPYAAGADGFVMGEGGALFLLKRLEDAERAGDRIYAVIRSVGGSSDGKGKGITAPNPAGQILSVRRAWERAGLSPATMTLLEGHGTSTRVGDVVEVESAGAVLGAEKLPPETIALGSIKSQIGHLKSGAGAAGLLKVVYALHHQVLPPSINFREPNPDIDFARTPFFVNTEARPWEKPAGGVRRAGLSAFGFGGTNFHVVVEEHVPGLLTSRRPVVQVPRETSAPDLPPPYGNLLALGAPDASGLCAELESALSAARAGRIPPRRVPDASFRSAPERLTVSFETPADLVKKGEQALSALAKGETRTWRLLKSKGIHHGRGPAPKIAFLFPGQGSQYANMLADLRRTELVVADTFAEADLVMTPILGRPLTSYLFLDTKNPAELARAEEELKQTTICQPAVLTCDVALSRLMARHGIRPDLVIGHSLGEWAAVVAAGMLKFSDALLVVSARARGMASVSFTDPGKMASVLAPGEEVERRLSALEGYLTIANMNSRKQTVIAGESAAVLRAVEYFNREGLTAQLIPVSHAFHSKIVAPATEAMREALSGMTLQAPAIPIVSNVDGELYPEGDLEVMRERLVHQLASSVQFVKGLETLYREGARVFVEVGPKRVLQGFAEDVLGDREGVVCFSTNHPKRGDLGAFHDALCGIYATGHPEQRRAPAPIEIRAAAAVSPGAPLPPPTMTDTAPDYQALGQLFARFLEEGMALYRGIAAPTAAAPIPAVTRTTATVTRGSVVVSGVSLGLPGAGGQVFAEDNVERILRGDSFIDTVPEEMRRRMLEKNIIRLVKREVGESSLEPIGGTDQVIRLAGRRGAFDLVEEFGIAPERVATFDIATSLAMAAGLLALRDAGIPLVRHYRRTTTGSLLPDRWLLPRSMADETGVIFASAFPGYNRLVEEMERFHADRRRRELLAELEALRREIGADGAALDRRIEALRREIEAHPYQFDRHFLFIILSMGHSQFAELVGARGPNTQVNSACASTTQALALAEDWIQSGRCRRVLVVAADDVTSDEMLPWIGAGFLATGAATTEEVVERAALPFDRRRHGMLIGMGACGLVLEAQEALEERGMRGLCEVLATETANSAFHGTRLDVGHIAEVMERLVARAEERHSLSRREMAREMVFVSHETFTPARGGSAAAEVTALRRTFGPDADAIVVANTKGFTGHPQGVGIEDAMAVKILERGLVPPVPNFREPDPELGTLNLSRGGKYPARYALRLAAGFGSQVSMTLERRIPDAKDRVADEPRYQRWLADVSGYDRPVLIVEKRTLRVRDDGLPARDPVRSAWTIGTVPKAKAPVEESKPEAPAPAPPAAVPPAAATNASPTASPVEAADPVAEKVLGLVSAKTGYPRDMLELDLDLEADLGIDTVKQAEVFALVREAFGIPRQENLKLRDYPTLRHVIGFVKAVRPEAVPTTPDGAQAPTVPGAPITDEVADRVLGLVSEKTGYPRDMLELDLDLEADLGIDTVKQAEIFAMVREAFRIPRQDNLKLRDYPTLRHVIGFVRELKPAAAKATATGTAAVKSLAETQGLLRVPTPTLRPALELCKETAVKLDWGSRVVVVADRGGAGALLARKLEELGVDVLRVNDRPSPAEMKALVGEWMSTGPVAGAYFLPALDPEPPLGELDLAAWRGLHAERVELLCALARALYSTLSERDTFLLAATRMGGLHGFGPGGALGPSAGAVTGFVKALARERPHALVKAIDFEEGAEAEAVATALMDETRRDPGAIEIGWRDGSRWAIGVLPFEELAPADLRPMVLYENSVFLVTGGAGAITGEIVRDLAQACHGTFHLVDARPFPDETVRADLARLEGDREGLQRALFERLKSEGERATPALVEKRLLDLERAQGILDGLRRVEEAGGRAFYHQADVTDADAVHGVIDQIRQQDGRLDVIVHAAGLERSRTLDQKPEEEFDLVFGVKAHGLFNLLDATRDLELRALVCFSSVAGRFGNAGQTDYSAANDLMAKLASAWSAARPGSRHVVTDWTAWGEIGMATRGSVPEMLRRAGIEPLSPAEAVPIVRLALTEGFRGELVVGRKLGVLLERGDPEGGIDPAALARRRLEGKPPALRFADLSLDVNQGLRATLTLDPREEPFLRDHAIDGTPVLPGVMGIEAFAELALLLAPGHHVAAIEDVRFLAPLKYYRGEPRTAILRALPLRAGPGKIRVHATLGATQAIVGAKEPPEERVLFSASVLLAPGPAPAALSTAEPTLALAEASRTLARDVIYRIYFHGPAYRVLSWVERSLGDSLNGAFAANLPPETSEPGATCVFSPRLVELCFQTAGVWEIGVTGQLGLPAALDRVSVRGIPPPEVQLTAEIFPYSARSASDGEEELFFDAHVRDPEGRVYVELRGYRTSRLPEGLPEDLLAPFRRVVQSQTESTAGR